MEFIEIPSRLNHLTLEEIELTDPDSFKCVINKLLHSNVMPCKRQQRVVEDLANKLARIDSNMPLNDKRGSYIIFNKSKGRWVASRSIAGKKIDIKSSLHKEVVEKAYYEFCKKHELKP